MLILTADVVRGAFFTSLYLHNILLAFLSKDNSFTLHFVLF